MQQQLDPIFKLQHSFL